MTSDQPQVTIALSRHEAVVLFELLSRFSDREELRIDDQAEERVLWTMCCALEEQLVEPFRGDHHAVLKRARDEVRDEVGQATDWTAQAKREAGRI